ncbi:MAG: FAD:protein FMN transferase, partial [bacterium]
RRVCLCFVIVLWCFLLCSCKPKNPAVEDVRRTKRPMMGTLVEIVWRATGEGDEVETVRSAMDRMETLASRMSLYSRDSELAEINSEAGRAPVKVSDELLDVIEKSLTISRRTEGAFDVTVGSVEAVWGDIQKEGGGRLPGEEAIRDALDRVGYQRVRIDRGAKTIFLEQAGMRLDLGGIAKGYIVDQAMAWLNRRGLREALINAGGDILASGIDESLSWRIGLQDPLEEGRLLGVFVVRKGAVVTSGSYERYFETAEGRFAHILDPKTGRPAEGLLSATVIAEESFLADALATALMVGGHKNAIFLLGRFPSAKAVLVEQDGTIWVEERLRDVLKLGPLPSRNIVRFYGSGPLSLHLSIPQVPGPLFPDNQRCAWVVQGRNPNLSQNLSAPWLLTW